MPSNAHRTNHSRYHRATQPVTLPTTRPLPRLGALPRLLTLLALAGLVAAIVPGPRAACAAEPNPVFEYDAACMADSMLSVRCDTAPVVKAIAQFWGDNYKWAGADVQASAAGAEGVRPLTWDVKPLGITGTGKVAASGKQAVWALQFAVAQAMPLAVEKPLDAKNSHGGLTFMLDLKSEARRGCASDPVLREDKTGWSWEVTPGRTVAVTFSKPLASLYFEQNNKDQIRAMLFEAPVAAGALAQTMTVDLPEGAKVAQSLPEMFDVDSTGWFQNALDKSTSFIDLSYLNEKPAGKHGKVQAKGDQLVFADGTPGRFWGTSLTAYSLFVRTQDKSQPNKALIEQQAKRLAQLGYNAARLTQHDTSWCTPNMVAAGGTSDKIDPQSFDTYCYWVKALHDQGIYVLVDLFTYRLFSTADAIPGFDEILPYGGKGRTDGKSLVDGFTYLNPRLEELWRNYAKDFVTRVNPYTGVALKDDPGVLAIMIWNENDLTQHFGNNFLANKNTPYHRAIFLEKLNAFAKQTGLKPADLETTWIPSPSKLFLNDLEYSWNRRAVDFLHAQGMTAPVIAGHHWGGAAYSLPALEAGDVMDAHTYGQPQFLKTNPRFVSNFAHELAMTQVADRPLIVTEYNMEDGAQGGPGWKRDAYAVEPYVAALAAFQGWDAPMLYGYSQDGFGGNGLSMWSSFNHPQVMGLAPATALLFREGHVAPARETVCLNLSREQTYLQEVDPKTSRAIRTGMESHRLTMGLPKVAELTWTAATTIPAGAKTVTDTAQDFIAEGNEVVADTGELRRNWEKGTFVVDTPKSQLATGNIGGQKFQTADATFEIASPLGTVALTSLDGQPLKQSKRVLVSTAARVTTVKNGPATTILSEPLAGKVGLKSSVAGLKLTPLKSDGTSLVSVPVAAADGVYTFSIPTDQGTHWFVLEAK